MTSGKAVNLQVLCSQAERYYTISTVLLSKVDFLQLKKITEELSLEYCGRRPNEAVSTQLLRVKTINKFSSYLRKTGVDSYVIPRSKMPKQRNSFTPYIFTDDEISRIFDATLRIKSVSSNKHQSIVAPVFFRFLYSTGMRISEVINLTVNDVDLEEGVVLINQTKFNKQRIVPLSVSMKAVCCDYAKQLPLPLNPSAPFFPNGKGTFYSESAAYQFFRRVLWEAGISHGGKNKGPRVHDFRHTFAVHCLRNWSVNDVDLVSALPYLSAYMGHTGLESTQKYLCLTADTYPYLSESLSQNYGHIIPQLGEKSNEEL